MLDLVVYTYIVQIWHL